MCNFHMLVFKLIISRTLYKLNSRTLAKVGFIVNNLKLSLVQHKNLWWFQMVKLIHLFCTINAMEKNKENQYFGLFLTEWYFSFHLTLSQKVASAF